MIQIFPELWNLIQIKSIKVTIGNKEGKSISGPYLLLFLFFEVFPRYPSLEYFVIEAAVVKCMF